MFARMFVLLLAPAVLIVLLAVAPLSILSADETLAVDVTPAFCMEPCMVTVSVFVEPHKMHRALMIEADSLSFYRSSFIDLEGDQEPLRHRVNWKSLPEGLYEVRATVTSLDGSSSRVTAKIHVVGQ